MSAPVGWLELKASAELRAAGVLAQLVDVALRGLGVAGGLCHDASLAVAELVANVHEHEYAGAEGAVLVRLRLASGALELEVESQGPAYDLDAALAESADSDPLASLESGGQGLRLVAALFDQVLGQREGDTNRTRLVKRLQSVDGRP